MKKIIFTVVLLIAFVTGRAQVSPTIQLSDTARIFAPGTISTGDFQSTATFTPDGKTVFFSKATASFGYIAIFYSTKKGNGWTTPEAVNFTGTYRDTDPFVSADGKRLYFGSDRPVDSKPFVDYQYHHFYVNLEDGKITSEPVQFILPMPEGMFISYLTFAHNGNAYFSVIDKNFDADVYMCAYKDGSYLPPVSLPFNDKKIVDFDPVISANEDFIIFCSPSRKGFGATDMWVSFKKDGTWTEPVNMGGKVNTPGKDGAPALSRDNKTLYFSSFREKTDRPKYKDGKATTRAINELFHSTKNEMRSIYEISISDLKAPASN